MAAYDAALHGVRVELGASRSKPGTVAAAVAGYFGSMAFAGLAEGTQRERRRILERFRAEHGEKAANRMLGLEGRNILLGPGVTERQQVDDYIRSRYGTRE
jgi:hypothetical protein